MTLKKINFGLINYGAGNIASVVACFERLGHSIRIVELEDDLTGVNFFILPELEHFCAIEFLRNTGLAESLFVELNSGPQFLAFALACI